VGGIQATEIEIISATEVKFTSPAAGAGIVDLILTNPDGQSARLAEAYTYQPAPSLVEVKPRAGALAGGTAVTVSGSDFLPGLIVVWGAVEVADIELISATQLKFTSPVGQKGLVDLWVANPDGQTVKLAEAYTYQPAPSLVEVKPRAGALAGGTAVTVSGNDLLPGLTVAIGGIQATEIEITSATEVKFTSPAAEAGLVGLILTNPDGQSATLAQAYTYQPAPSLTSVTPQRGASRGGTVIVLNGTGFFDGAQVTFGQTKAGSIKWVSETELRADTPIGEKGAVDITVTNPDGQVVKLAQAFTYYSSPIIDSIIPNRGRTIGGSRVQLEGEDFLPGVKVSVDKTSATTVEVISENEIQIVTPPQAKGSVDLLVTNSDGGAVKVADGFTYFQDTAFALTGSRPADEAKHVPVNLTEIRLEFGPEEELGLETVNVDSLEVKGQLKPPQSAEEEMLDSTTVEDDEGRVEGRRRYKGQVRLEGTSTLVFQLEQPLAEEEQIRITFAATLQDIAGNRLPADTAVSFTTGLGVWPGDTNHDRRVTILDILPIIQHWGRQGAARQAVDQTSWAVQPAVSWPVRARTYVDANGDGIIDEGDVIPIAQNWRQQWPSSPTSTVDQPADQPSDQPAAPPLQVDLSPEAEHLEIYYRMLGALERFSGQSENRQPLRTWLEKQILMATQQSLPSETRLWTNYPNPFNPETWIPYQLAEVAEVEIRIFNLHGELVRQLDLRQKTAAYYVDRTQAAYWDGKNQLGEPVSAGVYLYQLSTSRGHRQTHRMVLIK
jgi:hypothetical protein